MMAYNDTDGLAKAIVAGYYKFYPASLLRFRGGAGTSAININDNDMEAKDDKEYVEFKEQVIRYAIDHKLYSGEEHDYIPTERMLADDSARDIARLRRLYDALAVRYGHDKAASCPRFRIRKLTNRECFRLMDVDDADIDKIFAYRYPDNDYERDCHGNEVVNAETGKRQKHIMGMPISNTASYRLAGNSIAVNCLYLIFRNLFVNPTHAAPVAKGAKVGADGQPVLF